ncbi:N-terminal glutamine amidase-domain-containing protein, partial [Tuber brumale]
SYCEENIYCLVRDRVPPDSRKYFTVAFISNTMKTVPLFYQKASRHPPLPVTWDYHVLLIHHPPSAPATIYDFDTTLPFPCLFAEYYTKTLYGPTSWGEYAGILDPLQVQAYVANRPRYFRLVGASEYLRTFASTRKHMVGPEGVEVEGEWLADPPVYPPITCEMGEDTLEMFLDFGVPGSGGGWGRIVDEEAFWSEFAGEGEEVRVH